MRRMITQKQIEEFGLASENFEKVKEYDLPTIDFEINWNESLDRNSSTINWETGVVSGAFYAVYRNKENEPPYFINDTSLFICYDQGITFNPQEVTTIDQLRTYLANYLATNGFPEDAYIDEFLLSNGWRAYDSELNLQDIVIQNPKFETTILTIPLNVNAWADDPGYVIDVRNKNNYATFLDSIYSSNLDTNIVHTNNIHIPGEPVNGVDTTDNTGLEIDRYGLKPSSGSSASLRPIYMPGDNYGLLFSSQAGTQPCALFMILPTSDPHVANQLWNDNGIIKISTGQ